MSDKYDTNRDRVLQVAAELFAKSGYHGTGISDLGDSCGTGPGARCTTTSAARKRSFTRSAADNSPR